MKVGQIFPLPENILYPLGRISTINNENETKALAKYQVISLCSCGKPLSSQTEIDSHVIKGHKAGELKGKVIVTYGNKRRNVSSVH